MKKLDRRIIVWSAYFDSSLTRLSGRKVRKRIAVESPKVEELVEIAVSLGLNPEMSSNVRYPRRWWQPTGFVQIDKIGSKDNTLKMIGGKLLEMRSVASHGLKAP